MKADKMFNTFASRHQHLIYKKSRQSQKRKSVEFSNLSAIHLNPWHDEGSKSFVYLQGDNFFSSPKLSFNSSPSYKQSPANIPLKNKQKKSHNQMKKWNMNQVQKNDLFSSKQNRLRETKRIQMNPMNKTISVHNFQGEKIFNQTNSFIKERRKSLNVEKQKNNRKTFISNPMYLKFCNVSIFDKQRMSRRKKTLSDFDPKTIDFQSENIIKIKEKITTFSMQKGDINKVNNIHEVRRRLKSNSELSRRNSFQNQVIQQPHKRIFQNEKLKTHTINFDPQQFPKQQQINSNKIQLEKEKQVRQNFEDKQRFKLGQRKNIYIGYRKFFHPLYHVIGKDRKLFNQKQPKKKQIINFESLQKVVDLEMVRKNIFDQQKVKDQFLQQKF